MKMTGVSLAVGGLALLLSGCNNDIPKGAVLAFNAEQCPSGWAEFKDGRGRMIVGANPSVPSNDGNLGENGLTARSIGDKDSGAESVTLVAANVPPHRHANSHLEYIQVAGDMNGWPAITPPGRDSKINYTDPLVQESDGTGSKVEPINNMPPFVVLTWCQKT